MTVRNGIEFASKALESGHIGTAEMLKPLAAAISTGTSEST